MASQEGLQTVVAELTTLARQRGLSDSAWARLAGLPKESLSRLRHRRDCDWLTLDRLAGALNTRLRPAPASWTLTPDGHFPIHLQREDEQRLRDLVNSGDFSAASWRAHGPPFFMAGLAVLLAGSPRFRRDALLDLANSLHPGILEIAVYQMWLERTPLEPSRFFSQLQGAGR